jgi:tetratricopeptide (TPR) repeat protein
VATEADNPENRDQGAAAIAAPSTEAKGFVISQRPWLRLSRAKGRLFTFALRWLCLVIVIFGSAFATMEIVHRTPWYRQRLVQKLFSADAREQLRAATILAQLKCEKELLLVLQSDLDPPRELAQRALEHVWFNEAGKDAYHLLEKAHAAMEKKELQRALAILDTILDRYPNYAEAWNRRGALYWELGDYEKSLVNSQHALALNPNHYGAMQGIGVCRLQMGEVAEACRYLRAALKILPHDKQTRRTLEKCEELLHFFPSPLQPSKPHDVI